jgi:hypothetical protein
MTVILWLDITSCRVITSGGCLAISCAITSAIRNPVVMPSSKVLPGVVMVGASRVATSAQFACLTLMRLLVFGVLWERRFSDRSAAVVWRLRVAGA